MVINEGPGGRHLPGWDSEASARLGHPAASGALQPQSTGRAHLPDAAGGILLCGDCFHASHFHEMMM